MGHKQQSIPRKGKTLVNNKDKPLWKRLLAKGTTLAAAVCMMLLPATAHGYSVSRCTVPSGNINVYYVGDVVTCR